ncbi:hypothetical protein NHX12_032931 [Muraenolepis orangiensis]|uniref:Uncharacterized protein n=1 Tax=Muraenolepis orangiensis TaxID=630683 RepID=A0A9Q0E4K2_9TELE|nr:hypothetical protein NHX12_032931 [Muraenolepis orangiensis]
MPGREGLSTYTLGLRSERRQGNPTRDQGIPDPFPASFHIFPESPDLTGTPDRQETRSQRVDLQTRNTVS